MTWFQKPPLGTPLDWGNPLNDETVLALAMNEGHGDKVQDLSLNGNHGTLNNFAFPPTVDSGWNPGRTGTGIKFNGGTTKIDCGNNASLNPIDMITVSAWIHPNAGYGNIAPRIIEHHAATRLYWYITAATATMAFILNIGGVDRTLSTTNISENEWAHYVFTFDGTKRVIYKNGVDIVNNSDFSGNIPLSTNNFIVGNSVAGNRGFDGWIDQPRIQFRAWSAKEVRDYAMNPWQVYLDE